MEINEYLCCATVSFGIRPEHLNLFSIRKRRLFANVADSGLIYGQGRRHTRDARRAPGRRWCAMLSFSCRLPCRPIWQNPCPDRLVWQICVIPRGGPRRASSVPRKAPETSTVKKKMQVLHTNKQTNEQRSGFATLVAKRTVLTDPSLSIIDASSIGAPGMCRVRC